MKNQLKKKELKKNKMRLEEEEKVEEKLSLLVHLEFKKLSKMLLIHC